MTGKRDSLLREMTEQGETVFHVAVRNFRSREILEFLLNSSAVFYGSECNRMFCGDAFAKLPRLRLRHGMVFDSKELEVGTRNKFLCALSHRIAVLC